MGVKEDDLGVWGIPDNDAAAIVVVPEADPVLPCRNSWRTCGGMEVVVELLLLLLLGLGVPGVGVIMDDIDPPPVTLLVLVLLACGWSNIQPRIESKTSLP